MKNKIILFWAIIAIVIVSVVTIYKKPASLGLDLVGGSRLMLEAQTSEAVKKITPEVMDSLQYAIENRVNAMGVGETVVQKVGENRLLIEIPNITDTNKAKTFLGETAELEFKEPAGTDANGEQIWKSTGLSGKDLKKSLEQQYLEAIESINGAIFDNGKENKSRHGDAMELKIKHPELVYIDPPYYSPLSDNEYVRRYHFVEGLARDWQGVEIQENTVTKKFKSYPTPFSTRKGAADAFDKLFKKFSDSILIVSYSSNSQPTQDEMIALMAKYKEHVEVVPIDYTYSFGNQKHAKTNRNKVQEYLFVGFDGGNIWRRK